MLKIISTWILIFCSLPLFGQMIENTNFNQVVNKYTSKFSAPVMSVDKLKVLLNDGKNKVIIIDSRELNEYKISRIENAIHVGFEDFNLKKTLEMVKGNNSKAVIVVYCSVGYRSGKIATRLIENGVQSYNLYGGIFEWANRGFRLVDDNNLVTTKVHTYNKSWSKWLFKGEKVF